MCSSTLNFRTSKSGLKAESKEFVSRGTLDPLDTCELHVESRAKRRFRVVITCLQHEPIVVVGRTSDLNGAFESRLCACVLFYM